MAVCSPPSALGCLSLAGGSFLLMGCYQSIALGNPVQLQGTYGSAAQCITGCNTASYIYASISGASCYCGDSPLTRPGSASSCNLLCSGDNSLCGGYDGSSVYSEVYSYISGGSLSCPAIASTTSTSSARTSTSTTSSATSTSTSKLHHYPESQTNS